LSTKIRLTRMGSMKRPHYRLVVVDSRNRRDGRYIENLGTYNPIPAKAELNLREDRILHWLGLGAETSGTAESLIRNEGIMEKFHLLKSGVSAEELEAKLAEWKSKQPQATATTLSRAEKKAKKKTDAIAAKAAAEAAEKAAAAKAAEEKAEAEKAAAAKAAEEAAAASEEATAETTDDSASEGAES
jgi:small subunit ribosomal protein S16